MILNVFLNSGLLIALENKVSINIFILFLETCNCDKNIVANWYVKKPFVEINQDNQLAGIFPKILEKTVFKACGSCKSYPQSTIQYYSSRSGLSNNKLNESSLESSIGSDTDITFPIYSKVSRYAVPNSSFVPIVRSPGILFIVRDEVNEVAIVLRKLFTNIFRILPILVITYAIATLFGIIIWFIVSSDCCYYVYFSSFFFNIISDLCFLSYTSIYVLFCLVYFMS